MKALGRHLIVEMFDCDSTILNDEEMVARYMLQAAEVSGAITVGKVFHRFAPYGVSGAVVIAESHLSIHTWPEYGYAALDLFTCSDSVEPWKGLNLLREKLKAERISHTELKRGILPLSNYEELPLKLEA